MPSTVAARSCIASSSAACVLAAARLISSASSRSVKSGPGAEARARRARVEHRRADDVARHQVGRELHAPGSGRREQLGERAHQQRLAEARHALDQAVPATQDRDERAARTASSCPITTRADAAADALVALRDRRGVEQARRRSRRDLGDELVERGRGAPQLRLVARLARPFEQGEAGARRPGAAASRSLRLGERGVRAAARSGGASGAP